MLVDVAEFVQHPELRPGRIATSDVRLQTLDLCTSRNGDSIHSSLAYFVTETFSRFADGERRVVRSVTTRRGAEFPCKIVEATPQVLETVSNDIWDFPREIGSHYRYRVACRIGADFALSSIEVPITRNLERVVMVLCPTEFISD
jgi:hypothetical protein